MSMIKIKIGAIISIAGWVYLIGFVGVDNGYGSEVINFHSVTIANNIILLGYALAFWGSIDEGSDKIADRLSSRFERGTGGTQETVKKEIPLNSPRLEIKPLSDKEQESKKRRIDAAMKKMKS
jgi:hypothetical protein